MTIIVYRDGVMASDSRITDNGIVRGSVSKIFRAPDGTLVGASGEHGAARRFERWFHAQRPEEIPLEFDPKTEPGMFAAIVVRPDRSTWLVDHRGTFFPIEADFICEGSGREIAMGACAMGAAAVEAVLIAIQYDTGCGGEVQVLNLDS
jgi:20S proteasome alpha/beta subunit